MKIAIIIPAYNEEKSIRTCIQSCLDQTRKPDSIVVVNDGSTDGTADIVDSFRGHVKHIRLEKNTGNKSRAQQIGIQHVESDVFIATDADTILDKDFVKNIELSFRDKNVVALSGYVKGLKCNWLTACRELNYIVGQDLHKVAQSYIRFLFIIPGCAGAFRTKLFKKHILFDHDTLTEDLDFTYKLNKLNFKIEYNRKAISYTQDPNTIFSYIHQMRRWYGGGWQNLLKHIRGIKKIATTLELSLMYIDGFVSSILLFVLPFINIRLYFVALLSFFAYSTILGIYGSIRRKRLDLLLFSPLYIVLLYINAYVFLSEFYREIIKNDKNLIWYKPDRRAIALD